MPSASFPDAAPQTVSTPKLDITLAGVISRLGDLLEGRENAPSRQEIGELCDLLYSASLLKEEGRPVRARIMLAPPEEFDATQGPPDGIHAFRFDSPHPLSANEVKRLTPAASFYRSVIAVWPDRDRGLRIWGILNTGPRWQNLVAGGRKPVGAENPHPMIHVRDPGWLIFYNGNTLVAEWRGREFHGPRIDVFQSRLLIERFAALRTRMIGQIHKDCLPPTMNTEAYASLSHLIALQFVRRVINLVRTSGHGGSLVFVPEGETGLEAAARWIECKYSAAPGAAGLRFGHLLQSMIRRVGQLCRPQATAEDAWQIFRTSNDQELERLEEAFFELARFYADLMQVDGALVVDHRLGLIGFGGEIRVDRSVLQVNQALDLDARQVAKWDVQGDGTRHRSVYRLCAVEPEILGFVISQDSQVRMIANVDDTVVFWPHTVI